MRTFTRRTAVLSAGVAAATVMGVAFAAWTSNGSGSGSAASTTSEDSTITAVTLSAADALFPGATKGTSVSISNPNDYPVIVTSISSSSSDAVNGCAADSVRTDAKSAASGVMQSDGSTTLIAPNSSATYALVLRMTDDPSNACKSQTFTLPLTATLSSAADSQSF